MIKLLDGEFTPWDIYSACVLAAYRSYDDGLCWLQTAGGMNAAPTAVLSLVDGFAILAVRDHPDWEELAAFLRMQPWSRLQCGAAIAEKLPFPVEWTSICLRFSQPKQADSAGIARANDPGEVYGILARCFPDMENRNDWMADLALRWRKGTAKSWVLDNTCTASALALTEHYAFLGALGTLPEARGRGLAGRLLTYIAGEMAGREVWLSCREELQGFYESIGFERAEDRITLKKETA
ncbi:MAG: GNAT family N-acetyltransferase [Firmicutes bacterium]|nr:GNAT family N-acetyltransferase [Bacillota bacterium]